MKAKVYKTIKNGIERLAEGMEITFIKDETGIENRIINIMPDVLYQTIDGFGGAFTEAACDTFDKLNEENKVKVLKAYFDKDQGINYNFCRTHINSCDFSSGNYSLVKDGDKTLETFDISRDRKSIIPMIKNALNYNNEIKIFASPWSPPAYMKTNKDMCNGGKLLPEFYDLWAEYYKKFIESYKEEGIDIWGITVQNEPKAVQVWESCIYSDYEERDFIKSHLGEKMKEIGVEVLFWDHNKERIYDRAKVVLSDEKVKSLVSGIAFHWYSGDHFEQLEIFNRLYPDKKLIFSEGCQEYSLGEVDSWYAGERYAHDLIGNLNNYCNAFCDWNLILNENGGPNHVGNYCDAPIIANTETQELSFRSSYYYIGHFSKFIKRGAKRVGHSKWTDEVEVSTFKNPNGEIIVVVLNRNNKSFDYHLRIENEIACVKTEPHTITTFIITS